MVVSPKVSQASQKGSQKPKTTKKQAKKKSKSADKDDKTYCQVCEDNVVDGEKAMQCDVCNCFIHLICDHDMPEELYDLVSKHEDNPLVYLCTKCKPRITQVKQYNETEGKLADLSKQISTINCDMKAHSNSQVIQIQQIEGKIDTIGTESNSKYNSLEKKFHDMETRIKELFEQTVHVGNEQEQTNNKISDMMNNLQRQLEVSSTRNDNTILHDEGTQTGWKIVQGRRRSSPPPSPPPPTPQTNPRDQQASVENNRPPTDNTAQQAKYDRMIVIHNTQCHDAYRQVQDMAIHHHLSREDIVNVRMIERGNRPIEVEVSSVYVKWMFLREINRYKYRGIYARPYMTPAQLKEDRVRTQTLHDLRARNPRNIYKIIKGDIVVQTQQGFQKVNLENAKN